MARAFDSLKGWSKNGAVGGAVLGLGAAVVILILTSLGRLDGVELKGLDFLFLLRGQVAPRAPVVLVAVDYPSLQELGENWPWPRGRHAQLVERLRGAGAGAIGFDMLFTDPSRPAEDLALAKSIAQSGVVVLGSTFTMVKEKQFTVEYHLTPFSFVQGAQFNSGYVDLRFDPDGYVRRVAPVRFYHGEAYRAFSLRLIDAFRGISGLGLSEGGGSLTLDGKGLPLDKSNSLLINYIGPPGSFPTYSYSAALKGEVPDGAFKGKIVLVGISTTTITDHFFTPFFSRLFPETSRLMPGVEIHANIIDTLLGRRPISRAGTAIRWLLIIGMGLIVGITTAKLRPAFAVLIHGGILLVLWGAGYLLFAYGHHWVMLVGPTGVVPLAIGAVALRRFITAEAEKDFIRGTLQRYVSQDVVNEILKGSDEVALGGKRRRVTILFTDIVEFTSMCERISPEEIVGLLNNYFTTMTDIVFRHGGTVDKYVGDALMAFWGAPITREDDTLRAVTSALEMQEAAAEMEKGFMARFGLPFRIRIGINTGDAIVGNIGSLKRMEYTVIGDQVNIASRLEGLCKEFHCSVLISQSTYDEVKYRFEAEPVGSATIRGRVEPVIVYRVVGPRLFTPSLQGTAPLP